MSVNKKRHRYVVLVKRGCCQVEQCSCCDHVRISVGYVSMTLDKSALRSLADVFKEAVEEQERLLVEESLEKPSLFMLRGFKGDPDMPN